MSDSRPEDEVDFPAQNGTDDAEETKENEEILELNKRLDDLNSALDTIEEKNDHIQARLLELLKNVQNIRNEPCVSENDNDDSESQR